MGSIKQNLENVSIARKLMGVLVIMTLLVMIIFGVINYFLLVNQLNEDLDIRLEEDTQKLEEDLALHLWHLDNPLVERVSNNHLLVKSFSLLRITNDFGELMYEADNLDEGKGYAFKKMDVFYEGEKVGNVEIAVSTAQIEIAKNAIISSTFVILVAVSISVSVVSFLISRSISRPIIYLKESAEKITSGNLESPITAGGSQEIVKLSKSMEQMRKSVKKLIETEKNLDVAEHKIDLDKKLAKEKEEFVAMITHDLKQPLVPILGSLDLLRLPEVGELNEMQKDSVDEIHARATLLLSMIENLVSAQKLGADAMEYDIEELSSKDILNECLKTHSPIMKDKKIKYFDSSTEDIKIKGDEKRIQETLTNLVQNAHDFVPENGEIEIGMNDGEKQVTFFVKDNGEGIPKDKQDKLFKKYGQVKSKASRQYGGTGLGLAVSKGLVEGMGGKIWLESKVGKGTTFFFTLPKLNKGE